MATSKDFNVKNGLVVTQDIKLGGTLKDLNGAEIKLGGGGIVEPTLASYQNLATTASTSFIPSQSVSIDDQWDQGIQGWSQNTSKYTIRFMYATWMNWIADNYISWLPNPDGLSDADLRAKFKNKNYLMIGAPYNNTFAESPLGSSPINVGDAFTIKLYAVDSTMSRLDSFTAQTKVSIAPFQFNQYYNYYDSFNDPIAGNIYEGNAQKFCLLAIDWVKKSDFGLGETYGLSLWDPGWLFGGSYFNNSSYFYGSGTYDATASYLSWSYIAEQHWNVGYGPMGLNSITLTTSPAYVAQFNAADWSNVSSSLNQLATGTTLPLTHYTASIYKNSEYKLKIGSTDLGLNANTQFKKYVSIAGPILSIGQLRGYEIPADKTLALTGQLAKKLDDGTVDNYITQLDYTALTPSWIAAITNDVNRTNGSGYVLRAQSNGNPYFTQIGLSEVTGWGSSTNSAVAFGNSQDSNYSTLQTNVTGSLFTFGGLGVRKKISAGSIETGGLIVNGQLKSNTLNPTTVGSTVSIQSGGLNITGKTTVRTPSYKDGDSAINNVAILFNTANWIAGDPIADTMGNSVTVTGTVDVSDVVPPGATGKSIHIGSSSSNYLTITNTSARDIGNSDFTIETWVKGSNNSTNTSGGGFYDYYNFLRSGSSYSDSIFFANWNWNTSFQVYSNQYGNMLSANTDPYWLGGYEENGSIGAWRHVAITRESNVYRVFINGNLMYTSPTRSWNTNMSSYNYFLRGNSYHTFYYNYRLTVGTARYTTSFTPSLDSFPASTSPSYGTVGYDNLDLAGGMKLRNVTSAPTSDNTDGGYLFVEGGALKYRGSNGTVTTVGAA